MNVKEKLASVMRKKRTTYDYVKEFTAKIDVNLRLKSAIMDLVETNKTKNANNSAAKDLRDFFNELKGLSTSQVLHLLTSNLSPDYATNRLQGFPNLIKEVHTCCKLICEQISFLQQQQLRMWDYENMQKKCADFLNLQKENIKLKSNLLRFHQSDLLNIESLQSIKNQLDLMRNDNYELAEQNEQLEWKIKAIQELNDSFLIREAVQKNL